MLRTLCLLLAVLRHSKSSPVPEDPCVDGLGVYILESYMPCSLLVDSEDSRNRIYGIYSARERLCEAGNHECCSTCRLVLGQDSTTVKPKETIQVAEKDSCVDVTNSIELADGSYDCTYLLDPDLPNNRILGIYKNREHICSQGVHQCCEACQTIHKQKTTKLSEKGSCVDTTNSIQLAGGSYDCTYLLDPDLPNNRILGIYQDRVHICSQGVHQCCKACQTVHKQETTRSTSSQQGFCVDVPNSIQFVDGSYDCTYLLDPDLPSNKILGIYQDRVHICSQGVHQCCEACRTVHKQEAATGQPGDISVEQPAESVTDDRRVESTTAKTGDNDPVTTKKPPTATSAPIVTESKPDYTVQTNSENSLDNTDISLSQPYDIAVVKDFKDIDQLETMERRVQEKVDELQHEVNVLFASFARREQ